MTNGRHRYAVRRVFLFNHNRAAASLPRIFPPQYSLLSPLTELLYANPFLLSSSIHFSSASFFFFRSPLILDIDSFRLTRQYRFDKSIINLVRSCQLSKNVLFLQDFSYWCYREHILLSIVVRSCKIQRKILSIERRFVRLLCFSRRTLLHFVYYISTILYDCIFMVKAFATADSKYLTVAFST